MQKLRVHYRVEWFTTFCDFRKWTHCCRQDIFLWVKFQKNRLACVMHTRQSFYLKKKITGTLQKLIFFGKFANIFLLNNSGRNTVLWQVVMNPFRIYRESFCQGLYQCSWIPFVFIVNLSAGVYTSVHESLSYLSGIFLPGFLPVFMNPFHIYWESFYQGC